MTEITNQYSTHVIRDINDVDLVSAWKRIQAETDCFPQMYYEWCEPWWRLQSDKRELYIVVAKDVNKKIVGIAPLCIEKRLRLKTLRSFPVHFGDYYSFLIEKNHHKNVFNALLTYLQSFYKWHIIHLANINSQSDIYPSLCEAKWHPVKLSDIYVANFENISFDQFLGKMSRNRRYKYRYPLKKLNNEGLLKIECIKDAIGYTKYLSEMKRLYNSRWIKDHSVPPDDIYYSCRNEAMTACFEKGKAALFILKLDNKTIAFRLGFIHKKTFHEWKISHDPFFDKYSPGTVAIGKVIEVLCFKHFHKMDFMPGEYAYKKWWAPDGINSKNYDFFFAKRTIFAKSYLRYRLKWRYKLRDTYYLLLEVAWVRATKRWLQELRRR